MKKIKAIMIKPNEIPAITYLDVSIDAFNKAVSIGTGYNCMARCRKLKKGIYIMYADESNALTFPPNRRVGKDIITGIFYVIAEKDGIPVSLNNKQIEKYIARFYEPQDISENEALLSYLDNLTKEIDEMKIEEI